MTIFFFFIIVLQILVILFHLIIYYWYFYVILPDYLDVIMLGNFTMQKKNLKILKLQWLSSALDQRYVLMHTFIILTVSRREEPGNEVVSSTCLSRFSTRRIYSCERKIHQRDWLAKTFAFSSTNHVAEFCVRANKFA